MTVAAVTVVCGDSRKSRREPDRSMGSASVSHAFAIKIYLTDHGFREALLGANDRHVDRILENIVAMELIRRGWRVEVGKLRDLEIDFVATRGSERQYVQVTYLMADEATREREFRPLKGIAGDNYPRLVLSLDEMDFSDSGIRHQSIVDWCLGESVLGAFSVMRH